MLLLLLLGGRCLWLVLQLSLKMVRLLLSGRSWLLIQLPFSGLQELFHIALVVMDCTMQLLHIPQQLMGYHTKGNGFSSKVVYCDSLVLIQLGHIHFFINERLPNS